jgi:hypothetical protein
MEGHLLTICKTLGLIPMVAKGMTQTRKLSSTANQMGPEGKVGNLRIWCAQHK